MFEKDDNKKAIKEAFSKVKEDIFTLGDEISSIKDDLFDIKNTLKIIENSLESLKIQQITQDFSSTHTSTDSTHTSTHPVTSTHTSTVPQEIQGLKYPNLDSSIGNEGASTDRQTIRQTDNSTDNIQKPIDQHITEASEIIDSLDNIKKEIRLKFKTITQQEMLVFSTIYQLEQESTEDIDYKKIALKTGLSQSSIRDYTQRLINKGIPILKTKHNNKKITLHISPQLKKIASLDTILKLREI